MTSWQVARQIRFKLLQRTWPDAPGGVVFGQVFVTQGPADDLAPSAVRFPCAFVRVLDGSADPDDQHHQLQKFEVVLLAANSGDQLGEFAMIGGQRSSQGRSTGRGALEIEEQALLALQFADALSGVRLQLVSTGVAEAAPVTDMGYVVVRPLTFQARLTTTRTYPAPNAGKHLRSSVAGGHVTLSWTWHERFDLYAAASADQLTTARGLLTLVRKAGSSPPTSITDGTYLALASNAAATYVDTPGSGTWSYALFAQYDEFGDATGSPTLVGTSVRTSSSATASGIVVL